MLQKESEIPIEQLLEIYHKMEAVGTSDNAMHIASDDDDDDGGDDDDNDDNEGATKRRRESSPENGNGKRLKAGEESDEGLQLSTPWKSPPNVREELSPADLF